MGSTGAVPGSEAGGDRSIRHSMVSKFPKPDEAVTPIAVPVCAEHGNKESGGTDGVTGEQ